LVILGSTGTTQRESSPIKEGMSSFLGGQIFAGLKKKQLFSSAAKMFNIHGDNFIESTKILN